jgi:hypothetical protein
VESVVHFGELASLINMLIAQKRAFLYGLETGLKPFSSAKKRDSRLSP